MRKDVKQVLQIAEAYGFVCTGRGSSGHWILLHRSGTKLSLPCSPNKGKRWPKNTLADIKRIHRNSSPKDTP